MSDWPISPRLREYLEVQYDIQRVLGEGGMGVVFLAVDRMLDRPVAIKVLRRQAAEQPELRERFRREARVAARLTHPNIVPLYTFGDVEGELFFVMGFVEGEPLSARLKREGRIPRADALRILREITDALALAHSQSVVHRDIKPDNVLIEARSGRVLLADFGIARDVSTEAALTATGIVVGTPHYMSPEQATSDATVDHRTDIYAVGVLGYRMLTGRLPFDGATVREILAQQLVAKPRDLAGQDVPVSPRIAAALMRCLDKDPAARWQDAAALRDAISETDDDEEHLPEALADAEGIAVPLVAASGAGAWLAAINHFWWQNDLLTQFTPLMVYGGVAGAAVFTAYTAFRAGWRRTLPIVCRPPRFWPLWWPRFARRPGDVWVRLPRLLRWARGVFWGSLGIAAPVVIASVLLPFTVSPEKLADVLASAFARVVGPAAAGLIIGGLVGGGALFALWWKRHGSPRVTGGPPWLAAPNTSKIWRRREVAAYLLPEPTARPLSPTSIEQLHAAIGGRVQALAGDGVLGNSAAEGVARDVVRAIHAIDRELAMLEKGGDAAELRRLNERIEAAGPSGLGADIVAMLVRQRDAVQQIIRRQEDQRGRRERLVAQLRELHVALEAVHERATIAGGDGVTTRIEAVCDDLRRLAAGYDDLRDNATTPMTRG